MNRFSSESNTHITFYGFLILDAEGGMKLTRGESHLAPKERGMRVEVTVPKAVFKTPALRATIKVPDETSPPKIDTETLTAVEGVLKAGMGLSIHVSVEE